MKRITYTILLLAFFLAIPASGFGVPSENYETKIRWQSSVHLAEIGYIHSHALSWPWVYSTASEGQLVVTDVSDPDHPNIATICDIRSFGSTLIVEEDHLFISGNSRHLWSIDVSNPTQPAFSDSIRIGSTPTAMHIADGKAWIGSYYKSLTVIDISQPDNLSHVAKISLDYPVEAVQVCGGLAYIGSDDDWCIYDISNPTTPREVMHMPEAAMSFALQGQTLIVGRQQEISTYDVSNPANPVLLSTRPEEFDVRQLDIHNGMVLAQQTPSSYVDFFWLQDDGTLEPSFRYRSSGYSYESFSYMLTDEHIYYGTEQYLHILELGDKQPVTGGEPVNTPSHCWDTKFDNGYAFTAMGGNGLVVYDTEDPFNPVFAGSGYTSHPVGALVLQEDLAFVMGDDAITVFDVSDPTLPYSIGHTGGLDSHPSDVLLYQNTLWLAQEWGQVSAVDISDPNHPQPAGTMDFDAVSLAQSAGYLHAIDEDGTYRVLSLDTMPPVEVANMSLTVGGNSIDIDGDRALIGHGWYGLTMLDISDPENPVLLNHIKVMDGAYKVTLRGDTAILSNFYCAHIMDVSDPSDIQKIGTIWDGGFDHTVFPSGEIVIFHGVNYEYSMQVYPAPYGSSEAQPSNHVVAGNLLSIRPNPFNPQTMVSFNLPVAAPVNIRIYDLTGRLVKTLASGEFMSAGLQSWTWLGRDSQGREVSSGVYLVRLEAGQYRATGRMVLVR